MKIGRVVGITLFAFGLILLGVFYFFFFEENRVPRLFVFSPGFIIMGVVMFIFPGPSNLTFSESTQAQKNEFFNKAPLVYKILWISSLVIPVVLFYIYWAIL